MYLFDTNAVSGYFRSGVANQLLQERMWRARRQRAWISSIAAEELIRGRLTIIKSDLERSDRIGAAYDDFNKLIRGLSLFELLPYDKLAAEIYNSWPASVRRIGPMDCRIAATAIAWNLVVVTSDKDFSRIPGVRFEDWSK